MRHLVLAVVLALQITGCEPGERTMRIGAAYAGAATHALPGLGRCGAGIDDEAINRDDYSFLLLVVEGGEPSWIAENIRPMPSQFATLRVDDRIVIHGGLVSSDVAMYDDVLDQ